MVDKNNKIADKNNINLKVNGTDKPKKNGTKFGEYEKCCKELENLV